MMTQGDWSLYDQSEYSCVMTPQRDGQRWRTGLIPDPYWGENEYDVADRGSHHGHKVV